MAMQLASDSMPSPTAAPSLSWLENAVRREFSRSHPALPASLNVNIKIRAWRSQLRDWFVQMGAAFRYCPAIVENALFYLDCYIASAIGEGKAVLTKEKFQLVAMVVLNLAVKVFGISRINQISTRALVRLAPQLKLSPKDICVQEIHVLKTLTFNLFVTSVSEYVDEFLRLISELARKHATEEPDFIDLNRLDEDAHQYLSILQNDFGSIRHRQSVKAATAVRCALATWYTRMADGGVATYKTVLGWLMMTQTSSESSASSSSFAAGATADAKSTIATGGLSLCAVWSSLLVAAGVRFDHDCELKLLAQGICSTDAVEGATGAIDPAGSAAEAGSADKGEGTGAEIRPIEPPSNRNDGRAPPRPSPVDSTSYVRDIEAPAEAEREAEIVAALATASDSGGSSKGLVGDVKSVRELTPRTNPDDCRLKDSASDRPTKRRKIQLFEAVA